MSKEFLEIARSHIEWMNNQLNTTFVYIDISPINFNHIKVLSKEAELQNYPNPRIVVSTTSTFLLGHSRNLLPKVLTNKNSKLIFINKQLSHNLGPDLIKKELLSYTHHKVNVEKVRQQVEAVPEVDVEMVDGKEPKITKNTENLENTKEKEMVKVFPEPEIEKEKSKIEEDIEIINKAEEEQVDFDAYNIKLFSNSEYEMFPIENEDKDDQYSIDAYGVFKKEDTIDPSKMLNNIIYHLGAGYDPGAFEDMDMGFGSTGLNNSVAYSDVKDHFNTYKYLYQYVDEHVSINCKTAYIPFEGRIDKKSFQIMLTETRPKNLIVVNASEMKVKRIK